MEVEEDFEEGKEGKLWLGFKNKKINKNKKNHFLIINQEGALSLTCHVKIC